MASAVEEHVIARLTDAPVRRLPSPHFYIEGIFPDDFYAELLNAEVELTRLSKVFKPKHPKIILIKSRIARKMNERRF